MRELIPKHLLLLLLDGHSLRPPVPDLLLAPLGLLLHIAHHPCHLYHLNVLVRVDKCHRLILLNQQRSEIIYDLFPS